MGCCKGEHIMFRIASFAAIAATSLCAQAQAQAPTVATQQPTTTGQVTPMTPAPKISGIYDSDQQLLASPPLYDQAVPLQDMEINIDKQLQWLNACDKFEFLAMIEKMPQPLRNAIIESVYNARIQSNVARHDLVAQVASNGQAMAMSGGTPPIMAESDYGDVQNRPLRFVLGQARAEQQISYDRAMKILTDGMTKRESTDVSEWWGAGATDRQKLAIVRLFKMDAWTVTVPIYPSTLMPNPVP